MNHTQTLEIDPQAGLSLSGFILPDGHALALRLAPGTCCAIMGPSGSGKSLLLRAICDLDPHTAQVQWQGAWQQQTPAPQWRSRVAYLPAESAWWHDRVGEHFTDSDAAIPLLQALHLEPACLSWSMHRTSSGERQRMAIARLLARQPQLLLLDEPTANLDATRTQLVEQLFNRYRTHHQTTLLWITHDLAQAKRVATQIIELTPGHGFREVQP
ncbi:ABC transporter related protein [Magnetococcus marinus MC-1]|uniref:ABC transporter related protein n=1 Tax=Magnetococcus marinus (strain ATCC BAA-1437 / JCM 17883 / MC-1) TaxID=156889 RepID=A0L9G1_MAGMM|nr:ATP-binding cassette domain-containing protein [Magnetococcus marinus]ABK44604.1 ABC transporter related protein [Magnetococcus marinus MC-1]